MAFFAPSAWAQFSGGNGSQATPYLISTATDWNTLASNVNSGTSYGNTYFKLTADISASTMVGSSTGNAFQGFFNGNGHTLTVTLVTTDNYTAPFRYVNGATITNLTVAGTVSTSAKFASGLVGRSDSTTTIVGCRVSAAIGSSYSGDGTHGGLVSVVNSGTLSVTNTRFDGRLLGSGSDHCGGFVGWVEGNNNATALLQSCLFAPVELTMGAGDSKTFARSRNNSCATVAGSYYTQTFGNAQGSNASGLSAATLATSLGDGWQVLGSSVVPVTDPTNIATAIVTGVQNSYQYTGNNISVSYTVKATDGAPLTKPTHYSTAYACNGQSVTHVNTAGTYTLTLTGVSPYTGTKTVTFTVDDAVNLATITSPYTATDGQVFTGSMTNKHFLVPDGATITLKGVTMQGNGYQNLWPGIECQGDATIILADGTVNKVYGNGGVYAGIYVPQNHTLTITGTGSLDAQCGWDVYWGRSGAAGIGGSEDANCGNIVIENGIINALGGFGAPGIGGGRSIFYNVSCGNILIKGGTINATSSDQTAAIGAGSAFRPGRTSCGDITITNGITRLTATAGDWSVSNIGRGSYLYSTADSDCGTVTIGCTLDANGTPVGGHVGEISATPFTTYPYTVRFSANGGSGSMADQSFMASFNQNLTANSFTREGYTFMGWNTAADGSGTNYLDTQSVKNLTATSHDTVTLYAQWFKGAGTTAVPYEIASTADWKALAYYVNSGNTFSGNHFNLTADITVEETFASGDPAMMLGTSEIKSFQGTFDGGGHTLTVNYTDNRNLGTSDDHYCGPFRFIKNATIHDLHVAGTIVKLNGKHAGGFVGQAFGTNAITDCRSSVDIQASTDGDGSHGGFLGDLRGGTTTFTGCLFDGKLQGAQTTKWGGFVGWVASGCTANITHCLFAPTEIAISSIGNSKTFARKDGTVNITNSYYTRTLGDSQGKAAHSITAGDHVAVTPRGTASTTSTVGVIGYTPGIKWGDTLYAGNGDNVLLTLSYTQSEGYDDGQYHTNHGTLIGTQTEYVLTMPNQNVIIYLNATDWVGNGTADDPYRISNASQWEQLATRVNNGTSTYSGKYFRLTADITVTEAVSSGTPAQMVGTSESKSFQGTFDGDGHTITLNYNDTRDAAACAPFRYVKNATIKRLHVDGTLRKTQNKNAAGIVGITYGTTYLISCRSSVDIQANTDGDGTHGGIVARVTGGTVSLFKCSFDGKMRGPNGTASRTTKWGGLVGYVGEDNTAKFNDCLFDPSEINISNTENSKTYARKHDDGTVGIAQCYHTTLLGSGQAGFLADNVSATQLCSSLGYGWQVDEGQVQPIITRQTLALGDGSAENPYQIATAEDWDKLALNVCQGDAYQGQHIKMTADITANHNTMLGWSTDYTFQGHFDGDGHTLAIHNTTINKVNGLAPFAYTEGATIENLHVTGEILSNGKYAGGVVGRNGTAMLTLRNVKSSVSLGGSHTTTTEAMFGGLVGYAINATFEGCAFVGQLLNASTYNCGGFLGFKTSTTGSTATFTSCLFAPSQVTMGTTNSATFSNGASGSAPHFSNCYYSQSFGDAQGQLWYTIAGGTDVTVSRPDDDAIEYSVSGITAYTTGIKYNNVYYAGHHETVEVDLTYGGSAPAEGNAIYYTVNDGTITGLDNPRRLTMPAANVTISATTRGEVTWQHRFDQDETRYYKFTYPSVSATGDSIQLSALMAFWKPTHPASGDAIKSVHINSHYTVGANNQCPSEMSASSLDCFVVSALTGNLDESHGYTFRNTVTRSMVIMPDYEGYGVSASRTHPYLAEAITGQQAVDAVTYGLQVYQMLVNAGNALPLSDDWRSFSIGYSQGGAAALAVQRHIEQHNLSDQLHFRGTLCGDGPYDLIATLKYYLEDNGTSYGVTTQHLAGKATLPVVLPMIMQGMMVSNSTMFSGYTIGDYLSADFLATGILDMINSKTLTTKEIDNKLLSLYNNGTLTFGGNTYTVSTETMHQMFHRMNLSTTASLWANLDRVFTTGFYNYLTTTDLSVVPTTPANAYEAMHKALADNSLCTGWEPSHRIQFVHSRGDMVVPYGNYLAFRAAQTGENSKYRVDEQSNYTMQDHEGAGTFYMLGLFREYSTHFKWLDESPSEWNGSGTETDPYRINSSADWDLLATRVNAGNTYSGKYFLLTDNITVGTTVGTSETNSFQGTFDGGGYKMSYSCTSQGIDYIAPFRVIKNATIKRLYMEGTIIMYNAQYSGMVGISFGTCNLIACHSNLTIQGFYYQSSDPNNTSYNGWGNHGGFVGYVRSGTMNIFNCLFDGILHELRGAKGWGGFVGKVESSATVNITNCLFAPAETLLFDTYGSSNANTFVYADNNSGTINITNSYYNTAFGTAQGIDATATISTMLRDYLGYGWQVASTQPTPITAYHAFAGNGTESDPYLLTTAADWDGLALNVSLGKYYSDSYLQMAADIDVTPTQGQTTMVGWNGTFAFQGTFDGNGHTLTFNQGSAEAPYDQNYCAPFLYTYGATIQNLFTTGTITTSNKHAGGVVGRNGTGRLTLTNVGSDVTINSTRSGSAEHGGLVGYTISADLIGCAFTGSLLGTTSTGCGGLIGWKTNTSNSSANITDCLFAPASVTVGTDNAYTLARNSSGGVVNVTNSYYTQTLGTAQGKLRHSITGGDHIAVRNAGDAVEYNVSGITAYGIGIMYADTLYAGQGNVLSLSLAAAPGHFLAGTFSASAGYLSGNNNPYTLTMPNADVIISAATIATPWEGDGSEDDPFLIYDTTDLDSLAILVNDEANGYSFPGCHFKVMNDIVYSHTSPWIDLTSTENNYTPIGNFIDRSPDFANVDRPFSGLFDGNDKTISGIRIYTNGTDQEDYYKGLFGLLDGGAEVKNLSLDNCRITGYYYVGGIVGRNKQGSVRNCHVSSTVAICGSGSYNQFRGGIVGANATATTEAEVSYCTSAATIAATSANNKFLAAIVGNNYAGGVVDNNLAVRATVPAVNRGAYGAIAGCNSGTLANNYYYDCTVAGNADTTGVGCGVDATDGTPADVVTADGAVTLPARTIAAGGWYAIAAPMHAYGETDLAFSSIDGLTGDSYDLFWYKEDAATWMSHNGSSPFSSLIPGRGYIYRRAAAATLPFVGFANTDNVTIPLTAETSDETLKGFNLIGNPFPHAIYKGVAFNDENLSMGWYTLLPDGTWYLNLDSDPIPTGHAALVRTSANIPALLLQDNATAAKSGQTPTLAFTLTGNGFQDVAYATLSEDQGMPKMRHFSEYAPALCIPMDNRDYALATLGSDVESFPLALKATDGDYTLTLTANPSTLDYCHLIDLATGKDIDLLKQSTYTFSHSNTNTFNTSTSRFLVKLSPNADETPSLQGNFAHWNGNALVIEGTGTLEVFDLLGRCITRSTLNANRTTLTAELPAGVYLLRLGTLSQKVVIR